MTSLEPNTMPETPFVLIDNRRMQNNLAVMSNTCDQFGLKLRADVSFHRNPAIAQEQVDMGATGISCLTVEKARLFQQYSDSSQHRRARQNRSPHRFADDGKNHRDCRSYTGGCRTRGCH